MTKPRPSVTSKKPYGKHRTIFLIDDEPAWLQAISRLLRNERYYVITAHSGEDALAKLKRKKPDLILSDVRMPAMNGFELYEKVKENPQLSTIPFVFMSSIDDYDARRIAKELGAQEYVEKPYDTNQVKSIVTTLLSRFKKF